MRDSLFWLPLVTIVGAVLAGWATSLLGARLASREVWWLVAVTADARSALLQVLAGTAATVLGLATSALVITVQLASSQYSPRLVRTFIRDRVVRTTIAALLAVSAYAIVTLIKPLEQPQSAGPVEDLGATVALVGGLVSLVLLVAMIDRIARAMEAGSVIRRVLDEVGDALHRSTAQVPAELGPTDQHEPPADGSRMVRARHDGWLLEVDRVALLDALPPDSCVALGVAPGRFTLTGYPVLEVWLPDDETADGDLEERLLDALRFGSTRDARSDVAFGLRKLNDMILRALSPAVNDPGTAYESMSSLAAAVSAVLRTDLPARHRIDARGRRLLEPFARDHGAYVHLAYEQVRQMAADHPAMAVAMLGSLRRIRTVLELEDRGEHVALLERQRDLLLELVELRGHSTTDVERIRSAAALVSKRDDPGDADHEPDDADASA